MRKLLLSLLLGLGITCRAKAFDFGYTDKDGMKGMFINAYNFRLEVMSKEGLIDAGNSRSYSFKGEDNLAYSPKLYLLNSGTVLNAYVAPKIGVSLQSQTHTDEDMRKGVCQKRDSQGYLIDDFCTKGTIEQKFRPLFGGDFGIGIALDKKIKFIGGFGTVYTNELLVSGFVGVSAEF